MNNISVPQFFKDFTGSIDDFRILIDNLSRGTADPNKYGDAEAQLKLLNEIHNSFVGIHPTNANNSVQPADLGEWFYYNHRYYHMRGGSGGGTQGTQGAQGVQGAQGSSGVNTIQNSIEVGVNVGGYGIGDIIDAGTDFETIFRTLLTTIVDVLGINPNPTAHNTQFPSNTVEVGTIKSFTLGVNWVDGYFTSANTTVYTNERFNENNHTTNGRLPAGCTQGTVTYSGAGLNGNTVQDLIVGAQKYEYNANVPWDQSTADPKMSNNESSAVKIAAGYKNIKSSFEGKYKYFYGFVQGRTGTPPDYSDAIISQADLSDSTKLNSKSDGYLNNATNAAVILSMDSRGKTPYTAHAIIIPEGFHIESAETSTGTFIDHDTVAAAWLHRSSFAYSVNNGVTETIYNVYIRHVLPGDGIEYKNIRIERNS